MDGNPMWQDDKTAGVDQSIHRMAIQIVAQLPDDTEKALAVLNRARELLECWGSRLEPTRKPAKPMLVRSGSS